MESAYHVGVHDPTQTAEARRTAMQLASDLGFDETETGKVGLVVTEAAKNLLKHAGGGELILRGANDGEATVELLALDKGPGMEDVGRSFKDGYSTTGTPGTGLGAIQRLSTFHDVYSRPNLGTALLARIGKQQGATRARVHVEQGFCVGAISVPKTGEFVCGDAWAFVDLPQTGGRLAVADGLGHGLLAADAARAAIRLISEHSTENGVNLMQRVHDALRSTRGAAVAIADIQVDRRVVRFTGLGNIGASVISPSGAVQRMVSHSGTAGHEMHRLREFQYGWDTGSLLVLYSDGLGSQWSLDRYPGLARRHPSLIAGVLYRDFNRGRDDSTVVVIRGLENAESCFRS